MSMDPDDVLDQILVLRCQGGDDAAFAQIAQRWQGRLESHAMRLLRNRDAAAAAVQEAWLAIARGLRGLDDPARFAPWAYRILRFKCMDRLRRVTRERARETELDERAGGDATESAEIRVQQRDRDAAVARLRAAIRELPPEHRMLLSLYYFEEMSVGAIAEAMDLPGGTVKSRLFHLRKRLRTLTEEGR